METSRDKAVISKSTVYDLGDDACLAQMRGDCLAHFDRLVEEFRDKPFWDLVIEIDRLNKTSAQHSNTITATLATLIYREINK